MFRLILFCLLGYYQFGLGQCPRPEMKVPDEIEVILTSQVYNTIRQPLLHFRYLAAGSSEHWVSELFINQIDFKDTIIFRINGYIDVNYSEYIKRNNLLINPTAQLATRSILIPSELLKNKISTRVIIYLNGKQNICELIRDSLWVRLLPIEFQNIKIPEMPYQNFKEVLLFPSDVYRLYMAGDIDCVPNKITSLLNFGKSFGFTPAKDKYPQIPIGFGKATVYIVTENKEYANLEPGRAKPLGYLPENPSAEILIAKISSYGDSYRIRDEK